MTTNPLFNLAVDKSTKTVNIDMEFDAELSLVWDAFTKPEILDQWWAPKPLFCKSRVMDFKVGGRRHYAMILPDGTEKWAVRKYTSITPKSNFKYFNAFADKDENLQLPGSDWDHTFTEENGRTKVHIVIVNESLERMESILEGFKIGMSKTFENLTELLDTLKKK
jgi:uncharacterized protein YndB with AHSA1/START domain